MAKPPDTSEKKSQQSLRSPGIFHGGQDPQLHKSLAGNGMVSPRSPHIPPVHFIYTLNLLEMTGNTQDNRLLCEQSYPELSRAQRQGKQLCIFRSVALAKYSSCAAGWFQACGTQESRRLMVWKPTNSLGFRNITSCPSGQRSWPEWK